jgi:elongator complex protein 3
VVKASKALRDAGFKIGYHIMPGLPGSNIKKDLRLFKKLFSHENFKPDQLKLYPCQVMPGSELENWYYAHKYKPYTREEIEKVLVEMIKNTPRYTRIMRVMREIPPEYIVAGTKRIDLRAEIERELRSKKSKIKEIRFREIGFALRDKRELNTDLKLKITKYKAGKGEEYFLEIVNKDDVLFGLLRLRIFDKKSIIREIHVYGQSLKIGQKLKIASQHKGLGRWLMDEAESIVKKNNIKKLSVISGVGVREYYKKLGYKLENTYMVKEIK